MKQDSIALIELGGSHDECLYSQVLFLKKHNYLVHVILFRDHLQRINRWKEVDFWETCSPVSGFLDEWKLAIHVNAYLKRRQIRHAVINTAEGNIIRKLTLIPGRGINFVGLIHLSRKLWTSRSQRIISRKIKKYFVLADFIAENLEKADPSIKIQYFYPVYFPQTQDLGKAAPKQTEGGPEEFRVCIPGAVDSARRDYASLMKEISSNGVPAGIRFILLGRTTGQDGKELIERIHREKLEKHFTWFEGFVESELFYTELSESDLILPLIGPGSYDYEDYLSYKITGTYNLAWGFKLPMLMHDSFSQHEVFRKTSFFYATGRMLRTLSDLSQEKLGSLKKEIAEMQEFDFEVQAGKYTGFIRD